MAPLLPLPPAVQAHRCPPRAQGITGAHHQRGERGGARSRPPARHFCRPRPARCQPLSGVGAPLAGWLGPLTNLPRPFRRLHTLPPRGAARCHRRNDWGCGGGSGGEAPCRATAPARRLASVTQARRFVSGLGRGSRRLGGPEGPEGGGTGRAGQPGGRGDQRVQRSRRDGQGRAVWRARCRELMMIPTRWGECPLSLVARAHLGPPSLAVGACPPSPRPTTTIQTGRGVSGWAVDGGGGLTLIPSTLSLV